ncbi:MAG TPA: DUF5719 family protein [Actinomycetes bacterium]|nr:DUF5719 family protein [Actinomycetes bacterium]
MTRRYLPRQAAGLARQLSRPYGVQFRPPRSRTGRTLLAVIGALVLVLVFALLTDPEPVRAGSSAGTRVTVRSTIAVCPHLDSLAETRVAIAAPPAEPATSVDSGTGSAAKSKATVTKLGSKDKDSLLTISEPGTTAYTDLSTATKQPLVARAAGAVAPGFAASQTTRTSGDAITRSLSGTPCPQAATEFWFAGTGSNGKSRTATLFLINPENAPAQVDVELYGDDGRVEASGLDALTIPPGSVDRPHVLQFAAAPHDRLVVHVVARVGRVAAALYDNAHDGVQPRGADWIPAVAAANTRVIVPAVPGGHGERTLYLFVPGDDGALARLKVVGKSGTFSPAPDPKAGALDTIALEGNRLKQVSLTEVAGGEPFGVLIEADRPVIAALRVGTGDDPPDFAYLAASPPLGGPSIVADARNQDDLTSKLVLTAPDQAASVTVVTMAQGKEPTDFGVVKIKAGVSREVSLGKIKGAFAILITPLPGSGPVYASRVLSERSSEGDLLTIEQFQPSHTTALVPDVVNDLSAGLRPGE